VFSHFAATSGEEGRKALMREIELGKLFGESEQPNVIKFIGCVTTEGNTLKYSSHPPPFSMPSKLLILHGATKTDCFAVGCVLESMFNYL